MRAKALWTAVILAGMFSFTQAVAADQDAVDKGKAHFNNPFFSGSQRACSSCHPGGEGLENAAGKSEYHIMSGTQTSLEEAVNTCLVNANKGQALAEDSAEMQEMVAYIRSLGAK